MQAINISREVLLVLGVICLVLLALHAVWRSIKRVVFIAALAVTFLYSSSRLDTLYNDAIRIGADAEATFSDIMENLKVTPKEDTLPDDLSGSIVVFYRFGCPDCKAIYPALEEALASTPDVYYVLSRSEQGERLRETCPIPSVPTGVYFSTDGTSFYTYELDAKEGSSTVLDKDNIGRLLGLKSQNR